MKKVTILGSGVWGSAIANITGFNNFKTVLFSNEKDSCDEINEYHTNSKYIKGELNKNIIGSIDLKQSLADADYVFVILPSKMVSNILNQIKNLNIKFKQNFVIFTKGVDEITENFFSEIILEIFPESNIAVLSGPNFAEEVFEKRLTITTVATKNKDFFNELQNVLDCSYFNIKYFDDLIAVQLCGLVKNIIAILCGISEGLELGKNTFAAIITKGVEEIHILCENLKCNEKVINTPAGIGDMILTCGSLKSRNMSFGFKIGQGANIKTILENSSSTIEGVLNAKTLSKIMNKININNSIATIILDIINNNYSRNELKNFIMKNLFL